ncbi:MAG: hypothetical protein QOE65_2310 [Solirubrobacteraceae bacterium]|jgi:predicted GNAT family N-acyltransferase|nr:hypothetical protein [Solirubrobacteraceae bacterium]
MDTRTAHEIRPVRTARERDAALALRHRVFCEEQGVEPGLDRDGRDDDALHLVALRDGEVIGTCRLVFDGPTAKLGRMAVERAQRGRGVGARVLAEGIAQARRGGSARVALHAQTSAVSFYARAGFVARGEPFEQAGIEHVGMDLSLA